MIAFDQIPAEVWLRFPDRVSYEGKSGRVAEILNTGGGHDTAVIYLEKERAVKRLNSGFTVAEDVMAGLKELIGEENVIARSADLKKEWLKSRGGTAASGNGR